ncbi:MAG: hypothetical protein LAO78_12275 [Acidobacteriia bacterium]|nr:hypothetical protein [Terriglobia bacterium]
MALKSKEWFYKQCLQRVKTHDRMAHLCWNILEKGIGQSDSTRGHVTQAVGVAQQFLTDNPGLVQVIRAADPTSAFDVAGNQQVSNAFKQWIAPKNGELSERFGYSYDTFKNIVTPSLGGKPKGGGGGDDEFKKVLRLMAEFY